MRHEQKFKDSLSSIYPLRSERRVLDLESEVNERPEFYPYGGNILPLDFLFSHCKASDANIGTIANLI